MMLDVTNRQILIVGGGVVALRKAEGLLMAGARLIRVVAVEFRAVFPAEIERRIKPSDVGDLAGADLIFAATDSATVNDIVVRDARQARILVNRADNSLELAGDFIIPAKFASGSITVTVSAQSAALAAMIRDELQAGFDPRWTAMADAMQTLRPVIKATNKTAVDRAEIFRALATPEAMQILQEAGIDGLKNWISNLRTD